MTNFLDQEQTEVDISKPLYTRLGFKVTKIRKSINGQTLRAVIEGSLHENVFSPKGAHAAHKELDLFNKNED
jgi:hypothetical protein